jgi:predicted Rossmann-fold nucleotide-binding protein
MRKFWFAYLAKALVIFPGGFGTMDEMFEILTLAQTQKLSKEMRVVLYGEEYWDEVLDLAPMVRWGTISPDDRFLMHRVNDPHEAFEFLREHLTKHHLVPETAQEQKTPGIAKTRR